jgi:hypothetical protein
MLQGLGLMVRDARHCCAPHHDGLQLTRLLETSSRGGATAASKDEATGRAVIYFVHTPACTAAASSSSSGPTTSVGRWPLAKTSRHGKSSVGFSG